MSPLAPQEEAPPQQKSVSALPGGSAHPQLSQRRSLEAQYRRLLELELTDNGDEASGSGRPGAHSGFKAKLVTFLSRERKKGPAPCDRP